MLYDNCIYNNKKKKKKKKKKFTPHNKILAQDIIDPPKENPKATTVVTSLTLF